MTRSKALTTLAAVALLGSLSGGAASAPAPVPTPLPDSCPPEAHVAALRAQLHRIVELGGSLTPEGQAIADGGPLPGASSPPGEPSVGVVMLATNVPPAAMHVTVC